MSDQTVSRDDEIRIGISTCLLGEEVRYDGGHKRDPFLVGTVSRFVRFVSVCPEVEIGMGVPREAVRLVDDDGRLRLLGGKSGEDHTRKMIRYAKRRAGELNALDLSGYILKKGSPSCGMERVKVHVAGRPPRKDGTGLFASELMSRMPLLPVEEEGRLHDPRLRENFWERVFAYHRLRRLFRGRWRVGALVRFHTAEKLLLLAHSPARYRELGRTVAEAKKLPRAQLADRYQELFMTALRHLATTRRTVNVLQHMIGHLKKLLDKDERAELVQVIEDYRSELVPLIVPLTLIRHHVRRHDVLYLKGQTFIEPHPKELMLRNHV